MYYKIDVKKIKKLIANSLISLDIPLEKTPETFNMKDLDKINKDFLKDFNRNQSTPSFENVSILAQEVSQNGGIQDEPIRLEFVKDKYVFKDWQSLGQYLGLLNSENKEVVIESDRPILDLEEVNNTELRRILKDNYKVNWTIPVELFKDSWDNPEFVINKFKRLQNEDAINEIKNIPSTLLENPKFVVELLKIKGSKYAVEALLEQGKIENKLYLDLVCESPEAFKTQFEAKLGNMLLGVSRMIADNLNSKKKSNHPTSQLLHIDSLDEDSVIKVMPNYLNKDRKEIQKRLNDIEDVKYLQKNLLEDKEKVKVLVNTFINANADFEDLVDVIQLTSPSIQSDEGLRKTLFDCHDRTRGGYDRTSLSSITPPEYLDSKEKTIKFIKEMMASRDENVRSMFPNYVLDKIVDDISIVCQVLDEGISFKGESFTSTLIHLIKESCSDEIQLHREFFKRLVKSNNWSFTNYSIYSRPELKKVSTAYKNFILNDEEMFDYILNNAKPKSIGSLPIEFLKKIKDVDKMADIVSQCPDLLEAGSGMPELRTNVHFLSAARSRLSSFNIKKSEIGQAVQSVEDAILLTESCPELYKKLPIEYKSDYMVSLVAVLNDYENLSEVSPKLLLNKDFCVSILDVNPKFEKSVPHSFFTDKEFMMKVFKGIDDGSVTTKILNAFPAEITSCLSAFNLKVGSYENFGNSFFGNQRLSETLTIDEKNQKKKLKI